MDKDNVFKSCNFYLDDGDVVHVLIKDFVGDNLSISLNDNDGTQEDETEIGTSGELYAGIYGALYNWYAATDVRNIANTGWHVPTKAEFDTLVTYLGGWAVAGGKLKEVGFIYWSPPNTGAINEVGFNGRGAGHRNGTTGAFQVIMVENYIALNQDYMGAYGFVLLKSTNSEAITTTVTIYKTGSSIRLIKDDSIEAQYIGNDGKVYDCIKIGGQVWLASNLAETKYRNGDLIPEVTDNAAWAALTTAGMCYYNNVEI